MLQFNRRFCFSRPLAAICILILCSHCQSENTTLSADEASYLADYVPSGLKWGFLNTRGEVAIPPQFDDVGKFSEGLALVNKEGKWGYINRQGDLKIEPAYKAGWSFQNRRARVQPFGQSAMYITPGGKPIKDDAWEAAGDFSNGRAAVKKGATYGYIDTSGHIIIPIIYLSADRFIKNRAVISYDNKYGVIDTSGNTIVDYKYDRIKIYDEQSLIICRLNDNSLVFDLDGNKLLTLTNQKITGTDGTSVAARSDNESQLVDIKTGFEISQEKFDNLIYLNAHRWAAKVDTGYILLNQFGDQLGQSEFDQINRFSDDIAVFKRNNIFGFIDRDGRILLELEYGLVWDYKEGFARTAFSDGMVYLNKEQQLAFYPPEGTIDLRDFTEGLAPFSVER